MKIKVGMLVSYDYKYIYTSLPYLYNDADEITLAIDINRKTWSGNSFEIDPALFTWLKKIDIDNKIKIYQDDFYIKELTSIENDTRERNMLAEYMGKGGWHLQIDSDEYFYDFPRFAQYLKTQGRYLKDPEKNPIEIGVFFVTLFKKTRNGFLYIKGTEGPRIATNNPQYTAARYSAHRVKYVDFCLIHQSWAREEEEIKMKIDNWGHSLDFDSEKYFKLWQEADETNYRTYKNFHPLYKKNWDKLFFGKGKNPEEFISEFSKNVFKGNQFYIVKKNIFQYLHKLIK
jgi:hypothetical protein